MASEREIYDRDANQLFPAVEAVFRRLAPLRNWALARPIPAQRYAALGVYYCARAALISFLVVCFLICFFFLFLIALPLYVLLRVCRLDGRLSFLISTTAAVVGMILFFDADTSGQSLGPLTPLLLAMCSLLVFVEWLHFFAGLVYGSDSAA